MGQTDSVTRDLHKNMFFNDKLTNLHKNKIKGFGLYPVYPKKMHVAFWAIQYLGLRIQTAQFQRNYCFFP